MAGSQARPGFNEAAGIPRGRPQVRWPVLRHRCASMRPRVFPAEDSLWMAMGSAAGPRFNEAAGIPRGRLPLYVPDAPRRPASMRPRVFPAEDTGSPRRGSARTDSASMRPRVFPAEDRRPFQMRTIRTPGFNEAAGIPRGRRRTTPRHRNARRGFNEAAGIPRGRLFPMKRIQWVETLQ